MFARLIDFMARNRIAFRVPHVDDFCRHATHGLHCSYFGAAALEGHGMYAIFAGALLVLGIADYFLHFE